MNETKIDKLREKLIDLRKEREKITFEKGMAANENKDLRENSAYDYWFEKEMLITARINNVTLEIMKISPNKRPKQTPRKSRKMKEKIELDRPKWL